MTLDELKHDCETQGYQPNRATMLKLLEMIAVLSKGCIEAQCDCVQGAYGHAHDCFSRSARMALARKVEIERSL